MTQQHPISHELRAACERWTVAATALHLLDAAVDAECGPARTEPGDEEADDPSWERWSEHDSRRDDATGRQGLNLFRRQSARQLRDAILELRKTGVYRIAIEALCPPVLVAWADATGRAYHQRRRDIPPSTLNDLELYGARRLDPVTGDLLPEGTEVTAWI